MTLKSVILVLACAAALPLQAEPLRLSEPVQTTATHEIFGQTMPASETVFSLSQLLASPERFSGQMVSVETRVGKVCQKKGCFFVAQDGSAAVRVAFKDYGFFVPTDIGGKTVTLWGELIARELTAAQAEHFSQDAGSKDAIKPGHVYELLASAVSVPRGAPSQP